MDHSVSSAVGPKAANTKKKVHDGKEKGEHETRPQNGSHGEVVTQHVLHACDRYLYVASELS